MGGKAYGDAEQDKLGTQHGAAGDAQQRGCVCCHAPLSAGVERPLSRRSTGWFASSCFAERYETTATIVTSNLDFTEWDQAFPSNRLLASATLDRLRHNAYCLVLDGQSYRMPRSAPAAHNSKVASGSKTAHS